jgi:hypothetical protein
MNDYQSFKGLVVIKIHHQNILEQKKDRNPKVTVSLRDECAKY